MSAGAPLPVTIVSGYLGAGKTTLINRLLAEPDGRRLAILVNDFGEIAIDEELIVNRSGETIALANGCICCSIGGDLYDALDTLLKAEPRPDHLVIETSGVADPSKILQIALAEPELKACGIVTLIDAVNFAATLSDPLLRDTIRRQVGSAKLIMLTKSDAGRPEEAIGLARDIAAETPLLIADDGPVPSDLILALDDVATGVRLQAADGHHHDHEHAEIYRSWTHSGPERLSRETLERFAASADLGIYRMKGFAHLTTGDCVEIHRVGDIVRVTPASETARPGATRLVAIGAANRFSPERVDARWRECLSLLEAGAA
jgi:G3E family GTPase